MSLYIYRGRYNAEAVKGMMTVPDDREAAIAKVLQNAGGKLLAYYLTFGEDDFLLIADCPGQSRRHRRCRWRKHQQLENDGRGDLEGSLGCLQDCG